jgi:hypothetical protein
LPVGCQTSGECGTQRREAGEGLAQPVVQFAPEVLLFWRTERGWNPGPVMIKPLQAKALRRIK